jgi:DNA-binding NtrC family response regulator
MRKKILFVDDDAELCDEFADLIREEGYRVDSASDSRAGAALIKKNRYDACIVDYKMKNLNGVDLLRMVKDANPRCAVLIVSGMPSIDALIEEEHAADLVAGVIQKPFDITALLEKIRAIV